VALKKANNVLRNQWVGENQGLKNLLQIWRDDEKRYHAALKNITSKPYIRMTSNDFVSMFRDEEFLEDRYIDPRSSRKNTGPHDPFTAFLFSIVPNTASDNIKP